MKGFKVSLIFGVLSLALIAILWVLQMITQAQALDYGGKMMLVIVIFGLVAIALPRIVGTAAAPKTEEKPSSLNEGPKF